MWQQFLKWELQLFKAVSEASVSQLEQNQRTDESLCFLALNQLPEMLVFSVTPAASAEIIQQLLRHSNRDSIPTSERCVSVHVTS